MGTPDFAVPSLEILVKNNFDVVGVVTSPDKPAGRGMHLQKSAVKIAAEKLGLKILQPEKLKSEIFLNELKSLRADLQIVVAFRMLPEVVWNMPPLGTFNLHTSLLPNYRGAAPINHAIINGEKETGVTTFFLQHEIDTGKIIMSEKIFIGENMNAGELHDALMPLGAELVLKTVRAIESKTVSPTEQKFVGELKTAPKIFKENCLINFNQPTEKIHNFIRGLSPHPAAYTTVDGKILKIFKSEKEIAAHNLQEGIFQTNGKTFLKVSTADGFIHLKEIQLEGKKKMETDEFLRGHGRVFSILP